MTADLGQKAIGFKKVCPNSGVGISWSLVFTAWYRGGYVLEMTEQPTGQFPLFRNHSPVYFHRDWPTSTLPFSIQSEETPKGD